MKIFVITNHYPFKENLTSGIFVTQRLSRFKEFNVDSVALALNFEDDMSIKILKRFFGIATERTIVEYRNVKYIDFRLRRNIIQLLFYKRLIGKVIKKLNFSGFDLIHAHGMSIFPAGYMAMLLSNLWSKPYIVTLHGSDVNLYMKFRKVTYIEVLEKASKVIFVSKALLDKAKSFGYSGKNAVVIPNGYDKEIFKVMDKNEVRKELGVYKEQFKYVGFVGNLVPIKRADKLSEIFHLIAQEIPNTFFMVVGDGILRKKMEKEMKDLKVLFTGRIPQKEVAKYMNAMDVMLLPSRSEGWPCVVLEAQACGTCVIGSGNGGIPEAIGFEEYVIGEGKDFERRFSQKVVEMLKKGYDSRRLIERAKDFTWDAVVKKEIDVYEKTQQNFLTENKSH